MSTSDRPLTNREVQRQIQSLRLGFARAGDRWQLGIDQALKENRALWRKLQQLEERCDRQLQEDRMHCRQSFHRLKIYIFGLTLFTIGLSLLETFF